MVVRAQLENCCSCGVGLRQMTFYEDSHSAEHQPKLPVLQLVVSNLKQPLGPHFW